MIEDPPSRAVKKVRRREEDPLDGGGGSKQTEPVGSKLFSFTDVVMNSNQLNNSLNNNVVAWVRTLGLSGSLYKRSILQAIGEMVGNVIKIDLTTDKRVRGQFARFAVQIDLKKPLVSRIRIASRIHIVEYRSLPTICFGCGTFGHLKGGRP
ncbi:hypothetical protein PVK06_040535 [Gossypium arboreum]|uniref:Zinc knuckle CX2CX4HX4C domain-containing protein n=1 Tax=Gossypium arboreum TaxID=29729 RepID=A0ABR0N5R7_GOSAR|nr:hypothetical protein PVK06_040535 [Gossypium arboreum]